MSKELVKASAMSVPAPGNGRKPAIAGRAGRGCGTLLLGEISSLPSTTPAHAESLSAGGAAVPGLGRGAWRRTGGDHAGMVGQYLVGLGGSPAKRNLHLAALRGFFHRMVNRHVCVLNPVVVFCPELDSEVNDFKCAFRTG